MPGDISSVKNIPGDGSPENKFPRVKDNLAKLIIIHHKQKSQQSHIKKEICNRHKLPANCTDIAVAKMNKSVMTMKTCSEYQKCNDEKSFYDIQSTLLRATSAMITTMDQALKADEAGKIISTKNLVLNCLDAVTLLGYASSEINKKRNQNVRSSLNPQYRDLCNPNREVTEYLLGDNLQKGMKEAQECAQL